MISFGLIDIVIIVLFLLFSFFIPYLFSKKESTIKGHFQASGKLSWFVSGTAMVATTFAADTPLAVTELVAKYGISGNWLWWYGSISSIVTVYFFAPLWKKSGVLTDVELVHLRYCGKGSDILRIFKSIYLGFFMNVLILAWVNLAMLKVTEVLIPNLSAQLVVSGLFLFAFLYTAYMGLNGISIADTFQFFFAMFGCIVLAYFILSIPEVGGITGLKEKLPASYFNFIPDFENPSSKDFSVESFLLFIGIIWWSSWYPGAEPGGGGYIAQRILAAKNVKSSMLASLWFTIAHYFVRPWPWILVALSSVVLFPDILPDDKGKGYVLVMTKGDLPQGLLGLMIAVFMAAYLSTIATHLNWGSSYLINDLYKPYLAKKRTDRHHLRISKVFQILMMLVSLLISFYFIKTISGVWQFLLECGAGVGIVLILRWYIPRLNAWSELTGFIAPVAFYSISRLAFNLTSPYSVLFTVGGVILSVILITFLTPRVDFETLKEFYTRVSPPGLFWKLWAKKNNVPQQEFEISLLHSFVLSLTGIILIFSGLFSLGNWILGNYNSLVMSISLLVFSIVLTYHLFPRHLDENSSNLEK
ncbi:MAG: Na+:solute symporter [Leptospiraceae bacterium]|nr:Na+:solute symporter [Leptospiraceae bacterium]